MSIRLKYYIKAAFCGIFAAAAVFMAVFALTRDKTAVHAGAVELYKQNAAYSEPLKVDINAASERELQKLDGIGEHTAHAIVAYREEHGRFISVDELLNVSGIGQATLENIRPYIIIEEVTK